MMDHYFHDVVSSLCDDDMNVLGVLSDTTAVYNSILANEVFERSGLSEATYRKTMQRLIGTRMIQVVTLKRQHSMFITNWGKDALTLPKGKVMDTEVISPPISTNRSTSLESFRKQIADIPEEDDTGVSREEALSIISV